MIAVKLYDSMQEGTCNRWYPCIPYMAISLQPELKTKLHGHGSFKAVTKTLGMQIAAEEPFRKGTNLLVAGVAHAGLG